MNLYLLTNDIVAYSCFYNKTITLLTINMLLMIFQPTAEQMRIAQIMDVRTDDPGIREKVITMMETTFRSEEEVCSALHDCDNDVDRAVNLLFESTNSQVRLSLCHIYIHFVLCLLNYYIFHF